MLREQGCQVAARTYRAWKAGRVAARTVSDARVVDVVRELVWQTDPRTGRPVMAPEGLYGRRKMTALVRRAQLPDASAGSVDRAMRVLGLSGVRRDKHVRTTIPAKDGILVVEGVCFEAAVQDADEAVAELAQGCVVADVAVPEGVVVRAGSR